MGLCSSHASTADITWGEGLQRKAQARQAPDMTGEVGIVSPGKTWVRQGLGTLGRIEVLAEATGRYVIQDLWVTQLG